VARLTGVDVSAMEAEHGDLIEKTFNEATGAAGVSAAFVPAEKSEDADALIHCVDVIVAPLPPGSPAT
jgi:hypothetical protein